MVGLAVVGGIAFFIWERQPVKGTIVTMSQPGTDVKAATDVLEDYTTSFFSTKVTSNLHIKNRNEVPTTSILGQYLLTDKNSYNSDQLAITIGASKTNSVGEVSPVQFRRSRLGEYKEVAADSGFPSSSIMFINEDGFEKSIFWTHEGKYVAIVVSGGAERRAQLENSLKAVVTHWTWK